jgi:hypothetical protein
LLLWANKLTFLLNLLRLDDGLSLLNCFGLLEFFSLTPCDVTLRLPNTHQPGNVPPPDSGEPVSQSLFRLGNIQSQCAVYEQLDSVKELLLPANARETPAKSA